MAHGKAAEFLHDILANSNEASGNYWRELSESAHLAKSSATTATEKDQLWFISTFAACMCDYLDAFQLISERAHLQGWCRLEDAELGLSRLASNPFMSELASLVDARAKLIKLWQSVFPYRHFASPGMLYKKWECSICGKQSTPVAPCGHTVGRVYAGEFCYRTITDFEPLEISIVTDPVQKYSVLQLDYNYSVVDFVVLHVSGPFDHWRGKWTRMRHSHENFMDRPHGGPCPCESGLRYEECCLLTEGVSLPHFAMEGRRLSRSPEIKLVRPHPKPKREEGAPMVFSANLLKSSG